MPKSKYCFVCESVDHVAPKCPFDGPRNRFFDILKQNGLRLNQYDPTIHHFEFREPALLDSPLINYYKEFCDESIAQPITHLTNQLLVYQSVTLPKTGINYCPPNNYNLAPEYYPFPHPNNFNEPQMFKNQNFNGTPNIPPSHSGAQHYHFHHHTQRPDHSYSNDDNSLSKGSRLKNSERVPKNGNILKSFNQANKSNEDLEMEKIDAILKSNKKSKSQTASDSSNGVLNSPDNGNRDAIVVSNNFDSLENMRHVIEMEVKKKNLANNLENINASKKSSNSSGHSSADDQQNLELKNDESTSSASESNFLKNVKKELADEFTLCQNDKDDRLIDLDELAAQNLANTSEPKTKKMKREREDFSFNADESDSVEVCQPQSSDLKNESEGQQKVSTGYQTAADQITSSRNIDSKDYSKILAHQFFFENSQIRMFVSSRKPIVKYQFYITPVRKMPSFINADEKFICKVIEYKKQLCSIFDKFDMKLIFAEHFYKSRQKELFEIICYPIASNRWEQLGTLEGIKTYFNKGIAAFRNEREIKLNKVDLNHKKKPIYEIVPKGIGYICINFGIEEGFAYLLPEKELEDQFDKISFTESTIFQFFNPKKSLSKLVATFADTKQRSIELKELIAEFIDSNK